MTATFLDNFGTLVTRDYLDTRFTKLEARVSAEIQREEMHREMGDVRGTPKLHS